METASETRTRGTPVTRSLAIVAAVLLLALAGFGVAVATHARAFALAQLSRRIGRPVHVDGELSIHPDLSGFTVRFGGLHADQAGWAGPGSVLKVERGVAALPWTALLGDVRLRSLELEGLQLDLRRDGAGRENWSDGRSHAAPRLPRIARIAIRNSSVSYQDPSRALSFQGTFAVTSDAAGTPVLTIAGHGRSEDGAWAIDARTTTDFAGAAPYVLSGRLSMDKPSGRSMAQFSGRFTPTGQRLQGAIDGTGPNLHDLSHLINVPLPHTPTYRLHTLVDRTPQAIRLQAISGQVGASDLAGTLTITPAPGGRRLDGTLRSRSLRMSDLLAVASAGKLNHNRGQGRLLPDAPINPAPLRKLTGVIRLDAASVQGPIIRRLQLQATFDHGRVAAAPLTLTLAHGRAVIGFVLDGRSAVPRLRLDVALQHADTSDFRRSGGASSLQVAFDAHANLQGDGASLSAAAGHASGDIRLIARNGHLQQTQAAVLSANLVQGALSLLQRSHAETPIRCGVARFRVSDGQARATSLRLNTGLGGVTGSGGFNLGAETVDLTLRPASPIVSGVTSVHIGGPMAHPRATLAVANPVSILGHALTSVVPPPASNASSGCS